MDIQKDIGHLMDSIAIKPENEELLVTVEKNIEKLRLKDQKVVNAEFEDLIKWQGLYFQQVQTYMFNKQEEEFATRWDEQYKQILITSEQTHQITDRVNQEDERVMQDRTRLEKALETKKKEFVDTINNLDKEVDMLKVNFNDDFLEEEANVQIEVLDQLL